MRPAALWFGEAADHALDALANLDLEPLAAASLFVATGAALGENSFQLLFARDFKQRLALRFVVVGVANDVVGGQQSPQPILPLFKRHAAPVVSIEIKQIESVIKHRDI